MQSPDVHLFPMELAGRQYMERLCPLRWVARDYRFTGRLLCCYAVKQCMGSCEMRSETLTSCKVAFWPGNARWKSESVYSPRNKSFRHHNYSEAVKLR